MAGSSLLSSMERTQIEDDDELGTNLACHCLMGAWTKKKNDNKRRLVVIFSQCIKTKQKKMTTN